MYDEIASPGENTTIRNEIGFSTDLQDSKTGSKGWHIFIGIRQELVDIARAAKVLQQIMIDHDQFLSQIEFNIPQGHIDPLELDLKTSLTHPSDHRSEGMDIKIELHEEGTLAKTEAENRAFLLMIWQKFNEHHVVFSSALNHVNWLKPINVILEKPHLIPTPFYLSANTLSETPSQGKLMATIPDISTSPLGAPAFTISELVSAKIAPRLLGVMTQARLNYESMRSTRFHHLIEENQERINMTGNVFEASRAPLLKLLCCCLISSADLISLDREFTKYSKEFNNTLLHWFRKTSSVLKQTPSASDFCDKFMDIRFLVPIGKTVDAVTPTLAREINTQKSRFRESALGISVLETTMLAVPDIDDKLKSLIPWIVNRQGIIKKFINKPALIQLLARQLFFYAQTRRSITQLDQLEHLESAITRHACHLVLSRCQIKTYGPFSPVKTAKRDAFVTLSEKFEEAKKDSGTISTMASTFTQFTLRSGGLLAKGRFGSGQTESSKAMEALETTLTI